MHILPRLSDAYSTFFAEAFQPRSRTTRSELALLFWTPVVIYWAFVWIFRFLLKVPAFIQTKTNVDTHDSIAMLQNLQDFKNSLTTVSEIPPVALEAMMFAAVLLGILFFFGFWSTTVRRIYDAFGNRTIGKIIASIIFLIVALTLVPLGIAAIAPSTVDTINMLTGLPIIHFLSRPTTALIVITLTYIILQTLPTNMFVPVSRRK